MLKSISVSNVAVIRELNIDFDSGFTVITGETGAGKSIIIDSIAFLLGAKGNRELIRTGEGTAEVCGLFSGLEDKREYFDEIGVSLDDGELYIRRTISADGKTSAKINGRSVSASVLKQASEILLTIHGQNDSGVLSGKSELLSLLDGYSENEAELKAYGISYSALCELKEKLEKLKSALNDREMMIDILEYQYKEIDSAKLSDPEEEEKLLRLRSKLRSLEKVTKSVSVVRRALTDNETGVTAAYMLEKAAAAVRSLSGVFENSDKTAERLDTLRYEIIDISEQVSDILADDEIVDPDRKLDLVEKRLTQIKKLRGKYGDTVSAIIKKKEEIAARLHELKNSDDAVTDIENQIKAQRDICFEKASALSEKRIKSAVRLTKSVGEILRELDMPKVRFSVSVKPRANARGETVFDSSGFDDVEFLVSPNVGEDMLPISKIASGGEMSRIMLAIKSALSAKNKEGCSVFDEIDAGVSGGTSERIGLKLLQMSASTQIICITHSAQIAALADVHLKIGKHEIDGRVESFVERLDRDGRISELSRIIGGINITDKQIKAAAEMLDNNKNK